MSDTPTHSRREFLATLGGGLVIGFSLRGTSGALRAQDAPAPGLPPVDAFLRLAPDETVTVLLAHSEMGQGIWTTLPQLVQEELDADWSRFRVAHAPAAPVYAHTAFGIQLTGGSTTTWSELDRYRQVGALARTLLVGAAAQQWGVDPGACRTERGFVHHGDRKLSYGSLCVAAAQLPAPRSVTLRAPKEWRFAGKDRPRLDTPEKITGRAQFGLDVRLPGLLTAVVAHAPTFGGTVRGYDGKAAQAVPGVKAVVRIPTGVAVVADGFWAAKRGRDELKIEWEPGPHASLDSAALRAAFRKSAGGPGLPAKRGGDVDAALAGAARRLEAEYFVPYLAHATMEPLNCTVRRGADRCELWTGTQMPGVDAQAAAAVLGLQPDQVTVHIPFLGGGFGRRANPASDFVAEAAHVAKAMPPGTPVKLVWTREDDTRAGWYRPMFLHRLWGGLDAGGRPVAWRQRIVGQSIIAGTPFAAAMIKNGIDDASVEGAADSPYVTSIPAHAVELHTPELGVPVLWWRSVGHTHTAFAVECFLDELAHAAGQDPLAFRRPLLAGHPRALAVLELAAARAGWGTPPPAGRARGLAMHESFGSFVAQVAEVSADGPALRVHRVTCAIDCGTCVNPAGVRAQMEGGIAFGLGAALHGEITLKDGRVQQGNFHEYRVLRLHEMPQVDVHLVASEAKAGGAGEPGVPPIAPAVANAVFALTGKRLRELPLRWS
jgi:isoquinoline 1-oxidoreductase beta subunit